MDSARRNKSTLSKFNHKEIKPTEQSSKMKSRFGVGVIETLGLSPNLVKKLLKSISITSEMIFQEIKRNHKIKVTIFRLKKLVSRVKNSKLFSF